MIFGISHRAIATGRLDAHNIGGKTIIRPQSIERLIPELPRVGRQT